MDTEALAGFAMPARASAFHSIECTNSLGGSGGPPDAEKRRFSELIKRIRTNERRSPGGLRPKMPVGPFGSFLLIIECLLGSVDWPCLPKTNRDITIDKRVNIDAVRNLYTLFKMTTCNLRVCPAEKLIELQCSFLSLRCGYGLRPVN